uniref:Bromo domain-containing protein n=1 Tax=Globisporangium ultimum (strain ATCC 200006 / CBS 805.95 / DAOM BR144) TaxID=431595 RepID=K3WV95_GLOUD
MSTPLKLKLKLSVPLAEGGAHSGHAQPLLVGARGGAALKDLLSTAPNPEVAIRDFQTAHALSWTSASPRVRREAAPKRERSDSRMTFTPAIQLLDLLTVQRSSVYNSLLDKLLQEMLLRIDELPQEELQRVLEVTFPYIEFRELRAIPIAILSRQEDTPEVYLRELTENRKILNELPVHVRRKIMHVDAQELHIFVEQCTQEYIEDITEWYLKHPGPTSRGQAPVHTTTNVDTSADLWNVTSHMPSASTASSSANSARQSRWGPSPEERRRNSPALTKLTEMLGDSEALYLSTINILKEYVIAANIPGSSTNSNPKEYVDYVPFLGALRSDLANIQRDKTTVLLRTDPLHKFIWFLDRAMKNQTLETGQLHELLGFIGKLRVADLPPNKKFKKKTSGGAEIQEEEENFEIVLGPPPVNELLALLDKIAKTDPRLIFAEPVPDDVPKYREIIKEPMDLSTMRKKAKRGKYKSVEMFTDDFNLMIRNCMTFNPDSTVFYKEGKRIGKRGNELIEKNIVALRGEPQRIRAKKRRKVGPSEAVSMLTSTGVAALKDFGDVDQSGMVPEGMCDDMLADVAMILSDPHVKQLLCDSLMKTLMLCWQKKELPTDHLICRGIVQLLQIGNPSSVRRMIRKKDFVLRAPQVVTMRVVLPLLLRSMVTNRVYFAFPPSFQRDGRAKEDLLDGSLWENVLRASSAIRTMTKAFTVQCLVDHQIELAAQLLQYMLAAEDELLLRDRPFLHAVGEVVLDQIKTVMSAGDNDASSSSSSSLSERLKSLSVWKLVVNDFFVRVLEQRIRAVKESAGRAIGVAETGEDDEDSVRSNGANKRQVVTSFPVPVFHEKVVMVLASVLDMVEKAEPSTAEALFAPFVQQTLGVLRHCCGSLDEFELLWSSPVFRGCREFYELLLAKCLQVRRDVFSATSNDSSGVGESQERNGDSEKLKPDGHDEEKTEKREDEVVATKVEVQEQQPDEHESAEKTADEAIHDAEAVESTKEEGEEGEAQEADTTPASTKAEEVPQETQQQ